MKAIIKGIEQDIDRGRIRRVRSEANGRDAAVLVPDTPHWGDWYSAAAVMYHGVEIAFRRRGGGWHDLIGEDVPAELAAAIESAPHVGIATR